MRVTLTLTLLFLTTALAVKLKGSPSAPSAVSCATEENEASLRVEAEQRYRDESDGCLESRLERAKKREGQDRGFRVKFHNPTNSETETLLKSEVARRDNIHADLKAAKELYQHETDEWVAYTLQKAEGRRARNKERQFDNTSVDTDLNLLRAETARRDKIKKDQASFGEPIAPAHQHKGSKLARDWIVRALYERQSDEELDSIANGIRKELDGLQKRPNSERKEALKRELNEISEELSQRLQDRIDAASKTSTRDHYMAKENAHDYQRPHQHRQPYQTSYESPYQLTVTPHSGGARTAQPAYFGSSSGLLRDGAWYHQNPPRKLAPGEYPYSTYSSHALINSSNTHWRHQSDDQHR